MSGVVRFPDIESDDEEVLWYEQDLLKILTIICCTNKYICTLLLLLLKWKLLFLLFLAFCACYSFYYIQELFFVAHQKNYCKL